jgi:hypothetical protein
MAFLYTLCVYKNGKWANYVFALCCSWHWGIPLYDLCARSKPSDGGEQEFLVGRGCFSIYDFVRPRTADILEQRLVLKKNMSKLYNQNVGKNI